MEILDFRMYKYNTIKLVIESGGNLPAGKQAWGMKQSFGRMNDEGQETKHEGRNRESA
ncbi:unnamed protein product [marine sediment metagenome]|uniref:Uncharacterized protein n=1 Tax=marine sediment metagenome TaxID=412755 RepID=X0RK46_9ZZZZ